MGGSVNKQAEVVTLTVTLTVPSGLSEPTLKNLEDALRTYIRTMKFVRDATVKRERAAPPE